jgi:biopolymer transport protein ExbB/TolQ
VTVNLAGALGAVSAGLLVYEVASLGYNVYRRIRERSRLISPERAAELFDAIERRLDQNGEKG